MARQVGPTHEIRAPYPDNRGDQPPAVRAQNPGQARGTYADHHGKRRCQAGSSRFEGLPLKLARVVTDDDAN
jgi:hypothetical protein